MLDHTGEYTCDKPHMYKDKVGIAATRFIYLSSRPWYCSCVRVYTQDSSKPSDTSGGFAYTIEPMEKLTPGEAMVHFGGGFSASKYKNRKTEYAGRTFDSRLEARYAQTLESLRAAKDPEERVENVEYQVRYPMVYNSIKICDYVCDFRVTYADGRVEVIDAKGVLTDVYKLKRKMMRAFHGIEIVEV